MVRRLGTATGRVITASSVSLTGTNYSELQLKCE